MGGGYSLDLEGEPQLRTHRGSVQAPQSFP